MYQEHLAALCPDSSGPGLWGRQSDPRTSPCDPEVHMLSLQATVARSFCSSTKVPLNGRQRIRLVSTADSSRRAGGLSAFSDAARPGKPGQPGEAEQGSRLAGTGGVSGRTAGNTSIRAFLTPNSLRKEQVFSEGELCPGQQPPGSGPTLCSRPRTPVSSSGV